MDLWYLFAQRNSHASVALLSGCVNSNEAGDILLEEIDRDMHGHLRRRLAAAVQVAEAIIAPVVHHV